MLYEALHKHARHVNAFIGSDVPDLHDVREHCGRLRLLGLLITQRPCNSRHSASSET